MKLLRTFTPTLAQLSRPGITMPPKPLPTDLPIRAFPSASALQSFYELNHTTSPGIHLKLAKKSSNIPSVSAAEAVETALCYGWIDGVGNAFDDSYWLVRYTPRRPKSIWSQKNVATVARLMEEGRMRPAGLAAVEAAKRDGRWERAYASPANIEVQEDLKVALKAEPEALRVFEGMKKAERYSILFRVHNASEKNRACKIAEFVQALAGGKNPVTMSKAGSEKVSAKAVTAPRSGAITKKRKILKTPKKATKTLQTPKATTQTSELQATGGRRPGLRSSSRTTCI